MPRVIVADDHVLIREGLRKVLAREADMQVVGEAADFGTLTMLVQKTPADVLLMDINMPGAGAHETLASIRRDYPDLAVVVLSMMPEEQVALDMLTGGAAAFVSKEAAADELVAAIRKALSGHRDLTPQFPQPRRPGRLPPHGLLSPREIEVLRLIASGLAVKEIAARLELSISTVHTHRARILAKLQLRSDVELSRYAMRERLVI